MKTIVFIKTICDRFLYDYKKRSFKKKNLLTIMLIIVNEESSLTIVNEGLSSTIFKETLNFKKRSFLENERLKKIHATLLNVVLHEIKELRGSYNFLIFS